MSKVFSVDVKVWATAYIKADTPDQAIEKLRKLRHECLEMAVDEDDIDLGRVPVSDKAFDDPNLPELSLSPAMTVSARGIDDTHWHHQLEVVHDEDEAE